MYKEEPTKVVDTVNVVHYKPTIEKKNHMKIKTKVTAKDTVREQTDGPEVINIPPQYEGRKD